MHTAGSATALLKPELHLEKSCSFQSGANAIQRQGVAESDTKLKVPSSRSQRSPTRRSPVV
jgi:hypothetical protein